MIAQNTTLSTPQIEVNSPAMGHILVYQIGKALINKEKLTYDFGVNIKKLHRNNQLHHLRFSPLIQVTISQHEMC